MKYLLLALTLMTAQVFAADPAPEATAEKAVTTEEGAAVATTEEGAAVKKEVTAEEGATTEEAAAAE